MAPSVWRPGEPGPARGRLLLWPEERVLAPVLVAVQGGRQVGRVRLLPAVPGRVLRVPSSLVSGVRADAGRCGSPSADRPDDARDEGEPSL
ncbi:MAG: hypothetical protein U0S36_12135 [Candidatus Nanopelagicales bacterium]